MNTIYLKRVAKDLVGLEEIFASQEADIIDDLENGCLCDRSKAEEEFDDQQQQSDEQGLTNL